MLTFLKVLAAAAIVVVLWLAIVAIVPSTAQQEPPRPPVPIPAPTTTGSALTVSATPDIVKLNDAIAKLTAAVDRLNQQLVARDPPATKPNANPSPPADTPRRQEIYARQRRSSWRDAPCWW
jgi:hypothetical protein